MLIIFLTKILRGKYSPPISFEYFFHLFAYCFVCFGLMKIENPEENKVAANQNIICYSKMSFSLFLLTYLASSTIFQFWKAERQIL